MSSDPIAARDPAFANAYAISFRLIGDRDRATAVASEAVAQGAVSPNGVAPDPGTGDRTALRGGSPSEIAARSVELSLVVDDPDDDGPGSGNVGAVERAEERRALRRRFASVDRTTRAAAALVQLAGHSDSDVAAEMGLTPDRVRDLVGAFDPPPGVSWTDLGDPHLRQRAVSRSRRRRRLPVFWIGGLLVVVALAIWATTLSGQRPTLDPHTPTGGVNGPSGAADAGTGTTSTVTPDAAGTSFGPGVGSLPSAGCSTPGSSPSPGPSDLVVDGSAVASYVVEAAPGTSEPARLVVLVSEPEIPADELFERSALSTVTEGSILVLVDPFGGERNRADAGLPRLIEDLVATRCVDMNRILVVGFGSGAAAPARLSCTDPGLVAGIGMVAGWEEPTCRPDPTVAVSIAAASDDPTVATGNALQEIGEQWAGAVGADDEVVDGRTEETLVRTWSGPGGVTVETTSTLTGGHAWTVGASLSLNAFVEETARALG